jgi:ribosomal protein S18 acetylase RimI-like enzyme
VGTSDIERITAFDHRFTKAQASDVVELAWGFAVLQAEFPFSEYHNRIVVTAPAPAADVIAAADTILGGAGLRHRYVSADGDVGQDLRANLVVAGYKHEAIVTMTYSGPPLAPAAPEVTAVSLEELRPAIIRDWRVDLPDAGDEVLAQLADRTALYARGADVTLLATYDGDEIAAHADLYVDAVDRIAQFENLVTHPELRHRGYGNALVRDALRRSREAGCDLCFLTADLDDWPREWYERVGYAEVGRSHHFSRRT